CLAVRLNRRYERDGAAEALPCGICGCLAGEIACQPLLVGGEVIGSVLIERDEPLDEPARDVLEESVAQAAPILANLRNLAFAENQARTDPLTGLANRRSAEDNLRRVRAISNRAGTPFSVLLLDLDHFKQINDTFGHESGDDALAADGSAIRASVRESDFVARTGGEEFLVCLTNTAGDEATIVAEKILSTLRDIHVVGVDRPITASIGIADYPARGELIDTLMRAADRALYSAKRHGRDRWELAPDPLERATA